MTTLDAERAYVRNLKAKERQWLKTKPYGDDPLESARLLRDFSHILWILHLPKGSTILDLGCGPGWTSILLSKMGYRVTGLDVSLDMIAIAKHRARVEGASCAFLVADVERFEVSKTFDAVLCYDILHHTANEQAVLKCAFSHVKPGGYILIAEPNIAHMHDAKAKRATKRFGVLERGFTPWQLHKALKSAGFERIERYHASPATTKPYGTTVKDIFFHLFGPLIVRMFAGHFRTQIWLLGQKPLQRQ